MNGAQFSPEAAQDLDDIDAYHAQFSTANATRIIDALQRPASCRAASPGWGGRGTIYSQDCAGSPAANTLSSSGPCRTALSRSFVSSTVRGTSRPSSGTPDNRTLFIL
jgi:hypothetical protein